MPSATTAESPRSRGAPPSTARSAKLPPPRRGGWERCDGVQIQRLSIIDAAAMTMRSGAMAVMRANPAVSTRTHRGANVAAYVAVPTASPKSTASTTGRPVGDAGEKAAAPPDPHAARNATNSPAVLPRRHRIRRRTLRLATSIATSSRPPMLWPSTDESYLLPFRRITAGIVLRRITTSSRKVQSLK